MTPPPAYKTHPVTPLEERLVDLIRDHGPIRIGDYMADALGHPQHGYYMTQAAMGAEGDFTTAPEVSQIFGELVGAWLIQAWQDIGAPSLVNLIELGPGRGTLMADILRTAQVRPQFRKALRIYMVETSGRMRYSQQRALADAGVPVTWAPEMHDIPPAPTLVIANEFFDCLPIRQFVHTGEDSNLCWQERLVGLTQAGGRDRLAYVFSEERYPAPVGVPEGAGAQAMFETCEAGGDIVREIAERFTVHKGRALIIDYGHGRSGFGDTLQALRKHKFWPPLAEPGMADVTAHVDFAALARAGRAAGMPVHGPELQGRFLTRLGLKERTDMLAERVSGEAREQLIAGARRLIHGDEMGTLFKALCISSPGLAVPAGFE